MKELTQKDVEGRGWILDKGNTPLVARLGDSEPRVMRFGASLEDLLLEVGLWEAHQETLKPEARHPYVKARG